MYVNFVYIYILIFLCVCAYTFDEKKTEKTRAMWRLPFPPPPNRARHGLVTRAHGVCVWGWGDWAPNRIFMFTLWACLY